MFHDKTLEKKKRDTFGNKKKNKQFEHHQNFNYFHEYVVAYAVLKIQYCSHPNWSHLSFLSAQENSIAALEKIL